MDGHQYGYDVGQSSETLKKGYENRKWSLDYKLKWEKEPDKYVEELKIARETFWYIVGLVDHYWNKSKANHDYHVDEHVALSLWKLANGALNEEVETKFDVRRDVVAKISNKVYEIINSKLKGRFLRWPDMEDRIRISTEFENFSGIPNILGGLYTMHIRIRNHGSQIKFLNPRLTERLNDECYSLPFQGLVDSRGRIIDVFCDDEVGGAKTDEEVLQDSAIREKVISSGGIIAGGNTYPLEDWIMVPYDYPALQQTRKQWLFDAKLGDARFTAR